MSRNIIPCSVDGTFSPLPHNINVKMTIDFYYASWSPPCRTVQLVAAIINVKLNPILTTPGKGDTQKPEFKHVYNRTRPCHITKWRVNLLFLQLFFVWILQMNPQHTIPTIVDDGFVLSERWVLWWNNFVNIFPMLIETHKFIHIYA